MPRSATYVRSRRGASALTYGLLLGLVAVAALVQTAALGGSVNQLFGQVSTRLLGLRPAPVQPAATPVPTSCAGWTAAGAPSGLQTVDVQGTAMTLFCDTATDGGGWTRIMVLTDTTNMTETTAVNIAQLSQVTPSARTKLADSQISALARAGQRQYMMVKGSTVYILRASDTAWSGFSSTGWTNQVFDSKNSSGVFVLNTCNGHYNNRGFSSYSDTNGSACPVVFAGGALYMTQYHTTAGFAPGGPFQVFVR